VRGVLNVQTQPMIGIVGSRNASGAGLKFAQTIARGSRRADLPSHRDSHAASIRRRIA
jgi:predicted Rossmann fold nucleotide-binding protein DprA/Smf involved in DNA uptake